ncbi:MAG: pyrroline-5-carboxylate reductase [Verrucomicrobiae bacterium]|nr:pyrroline-5-carboxylate reductase [Verrucomicrobiae bacterium]
MKVAFLGAGRMATALAHGLIEKKVLTSEHVFASDPADEARASFEKRTGAKTFSDNRRMLEHAEIIILAVKPQQVKTLLEKIGSSLENKLFISIAAGVVLARLESLVHATTRLIRVMPNTPALVGAGASVFSLGARATEKDAMVVKGLFSAVGLVEQVPEAWLNEVTALSGSGPAYFFAILEALLDRAAIQHLPDDLALKLATQTMLGAAKMVLETGKSLSELREAVTSPGGTTFEALQVLKNRNMHEAFVEAVQAATRRSKELSALA